MPKSKKKSTAALDDISNGEISLDDSGHGADDSLNLNEARHTSHGYFLPLTETATNFLDTALDGRTLHAIVAEWIAVEEPKFAEVRKIALRSEHTSLFCPISHQVMTSPMVMNDGYTYERLSISRWVNKIRPTSPHNPDIIIDKLNYSENDEVNKKVEEAAEAGLPEAQGAMAERCYFGVGGNRKDEEKAVEWAKKAAAGGDMKATFRLAYCYEHADGGLAVDWVQAVKHYEEAAEQGCTMAMNNLGCMHRGGHNLPEDTAKSFSWYEKAAKAGNHISQHHYAFMIYAGDEFSRGTVTPKEIAAARSWFKLSADKGFMPAICQLG